MKEWGKPFTLGSIHLATFGKGLLSSVCNMQHCLWFFRDDDKFGRRERYSGPTSDFKEKEGYKPNVKLDYIDDDGRVLNAKEAFRWALIGLINL